MGRRANAVLSVTVEDQPLDAHMDKMAKVKAAWEMLGADLKELGTAYSKGMGEELKKISTAMGSLGKIKDAEGLKSLVTSLKGSADDVSKFTVAAQKLAPVMGPLAEDTKKWANALNRANKAMGILDTRTEALMEAQKKTTRHMDQFSQELDHVHQQLRAQGADMLKLVQAYAGFNKAVAKSKALGGGGPGGGRRESIKGFMGSLAQFERTFIRHATTIFIAGQWFKHSAEAFRDAAVQIDLESVLGRSVDGFAGILRDARESTRGLVSDLQLMKSAALMSSFGLPMERFASMMGLVQKMAVRTGQDTEYLINSLATGVSRLSPRILDNLGIQIRLGDAFEAQAAALGISTDRLDDYNRKLAVMNEVERQAVQLTAEVDPAASLQARLDALQTRVTNFIQDIKGGILEAIMFVASTEEERLAMAIDKLKLMNKEVETYGRVMSDAAKGIIVATERGAQKATELEFALAGMSLAMSFGGEEELRELEEIFITQGKIVDITRLTREEAEKVIKQRERWRDLEVFASEITERRADAAERLREAFVVINSFEFKDWDRIVRSLGDFALWDRLETEVTDMFVVLREYRKEVAKISKEMDKTAGVTFFKDMTEEIRRMEVMLRELRETALVEGEQGIAHRILLGLGGEAGVERALENLENRVKALAVFRASNFRITHALEIQTLNTLDQQTKLRERGFKLSKGQTELQLDLVDTQSALNAALSEAEKLMSESKAHMGAGAKATDLQVFWAQEYVRMLQIARDLQINMRGEEELYQKALDSSLDGAKDIRDVQFEIISGGRSRQQIETLISGLLSEQAGHTGALADAQARLKSDKQGTVALAVMEFAMAQANLELGKARIIELMKLAQNISKQTGGRGRTERRERERRPRLVREDRFEDLPTRFSDVDRMGNLIQMRVQELDGLVRTLDESTAHMIQTFVSGSGPLFEEATGGIFGTDFIKKIEDNEEVIKRLVDEGYRSGFTPEILESVSALERANIVLTEHRDLLLDISRNTEQWAIANEWAMRSAHGLAGEDTIQVLLGLGEAVQSVSDVMQQAITGEASSYDALLAGMSGIRAFTNAFIKDRKDRAKVEMWMNAAAAFAAAGTGNWAAAAAHTQAAIMYGVVAGGKVKLPSQATKDDSGDGRRERGGPLHLHIYSEMGFTDAERGYLIDRAEQMAAAEGRDSY